MQDFPLEELGTRAFEQLTAALAAVVIGSGIEAFGSGPDGGREATFRGTIRWTSVSGSIEDNWSGYTVIQAKQKEHSSSPSENYQWLVGQVSDELDSWFDPSRNRQEIPDNLLIVTNVRLSSATDGGIDKINNFIGRKIQNARADGSEVASRAKQIRHWKVWHRDQLNAYLTAYPGVRAAFPGMLTAGDVLSRFTSLPNPPDASVLLPILLEHAEKAIAAERWVNFSEAGGISRASVEEVAIDLGCTHGHGRRRSVFEELITRSDSVLKRSAWTDRTRRHIVLTGRAGSGKSTSTKFLSQVLRAHFLANEELTDTPADIIDRTRDAMTRNESREPKNLRWPIRVDLPSYADALGPNGDKDLVRWLCETVSKRASHDLLPYQLRSWLNAWPTALFLDGLDEVTAPEVRIRVIDEIRALVEGLDRDDADALVVLTTRPTGFTEPVMPEHFEQLDLTLLDNDEAMSYGELVTRRRLADDPDRRDQVVSKLRGLSPDSPQGRLMNTPLQVLIMTLILERFGVLPPDRYQLFSRYFDTVLERESSKTTSLQSLLTNHRRTVVEVHEHAGLELQQQSETSNHSRALLSQERLFEIARSCLEAVGYDESNGISRVCEQIVQAATERLVLLVPGEDSCFSFEVRSLQELMAANALSRTSDDLLESNLRATSHSPHWRNTWVFAAGKAFADGSEERREMVVRTVESVDVDETWPSWLCPSGPELAGDLLVDGMAAATPRWQERLIDVALRSLNGPAPADFNVVAAGLASVSTNGRPAAVVTNAIRDAKSGNARSRALGEVLESVVLGSRSARQPAGKREAPAPHRAWSGTTLAKFMGPFRASIPAPSGATAKLVDSAFEDFEYIEFETDAEGNAASQRALWRVDLPSFANALSDPSASRHLRDLFGALPPEQWRLVRTVSRAASGVLGRTPVTLSLHADGAHARGTT